MAYKEKKSYGGRMGGFNARSGYFKPSRDAMAPYRHMPPPETEYTRRVRDSVLRSELSGPSSISSRWPNYKISQDSKTEVGTTRTEVEKMVESALDDALAQIKERSDSAEIPQEKYKTMRETADDIKEKLEISHSAGGEETVVDFVNEFLQDDFNSERTSRLSELNELRQDLVNQKWKEAEEIGTFEELGRITGEVDRINNDFFKHLDNTELTEDNEQAPLSWDEMQQRLGHVKYGIEDLIERNHGLQKQIDDDISQVDSMNGRLDTMRNGLTDSIDLSYTEQQRKTRNYDSEIGG